MKHDLRGELQTALEHRINNGTTWLGVPARKQPCDAWVYQEIIFELRPDVIVEVGNKDGGALLFLAAICDLIGHGDVIGIDNDRTGQVDHPRVHTIDGDALDVFPRAQAAVAGRSCLVIEDSAHTYKHTLAVLRTYGALVHPGGYLICEDGDMPDVARALRKFSREQEVFVADRSREWPVSWNPNGFLRRLVQP